MSELNERLRNQVGIQTLQIRAAFDRLGEPAVVRGGRVNDGSIAYFVRTGLELSSEQLRRAGLLLAAMFGRSGFRLGREGDGLQLRLARRQADGLPLLDLMALFEGQTGPRIVLGLDYAERPVTIDLLAGRSANVLVAGGPGSGKTSILRSAVLSAAWQSDQGELQWVLIDGGPARDRAAVTELLPLGRLPHMQFPVIVDAEEAVEVLEFLVAEAEYRQEQGFERPLLAVGIDNVDWLLAAAGTRAAGPLATLLENGRRVGIRTLLAATDAGHEPLHWLLRHNTDLRLVGRVGSREEARLATGRPDSHAEYLQNAGDFLAVRGQQLVPFQAAFVDDYDMYYALQQLSRPRLKALFARPYRPGGEATAHGEGGFIAFEVDEFSGEVRAAEDANPAAVHALLMPDLDDSDDAGEVTGEPAADLLPFEWPVTTSASDEPAAGSRPAGNKKGARGSHPARQPAKLVNGRKNGHGRTSPRSEPPASGDLVYERDDDFVDWEEPEG